MYSTSDRTIVFVPAVTSEPSCRGDSGCSPWKKQSAPPLGTFTVRMCAPGPEIDAAGRPEPSTRKVVPPPSYLDQRGWGGVKNKTERLAHGPLLRHSQHMGGNVSNTKQSSPPSVRDHV
eukprot:scaffold1153_cov94-Isochrysis_galbana.AAC.4